MRKLSYSHFRFDMGDGNLLIVTTADISGKHCTSEKVIWQEAEARLTEAMDRPHALRPKAFSAGRKWKLVEDMKIDEPRLRRVCELSPSYDEAEAIIEHHKRAGVVKEIHNVNAGAPKYYNWRGIEWKVHGPPDAVLADLQAGEIMSDFTVAFAGDDYTGGDDRPPARSRSPDEFDISFF